MPRRPTQPVLNVTAFSIVSQVTGPPFSQALANPRLREQLIGEMSRSAKIARDQSAATEAARAKGKPSAKETARKKRPAGK